MGVVLRLARHGKHKSPAYRIVAADKQANRDGRFLQVIGTYNTLQNPPLCIMKEDLVKKWVELGAIPSSMVRDLIRKQIPGYIESKEEHRTKKTLAARQKRKAKAKASGTKTSAPKAAKAAKPKAAPKAKAEAKE